MIACTLGIFLSNTLETHLKAIDSLITTIAIFLCPLLPGKKRILGVDGEWVMHNIDGVGSLLKLSVLGFLISTNRSNSARESMLRILL